MSMFSAKEPRGPKHGSAGMQVLRKVALLLGTLGLDNADNYKAPLMTNNTNKNHHKSVVERY